MRAKTTRAGAVARSATAVTAAALCLPLLVLLTLLPPRRAEAQDIATEPPAEDSIASRLGLRLHALQPQDGNDTGSPQQLWIDAVSGPSARAGVQAGDVLIAVNGIPVRSIAQVKQLVARSKKSLALLIERDQRQFFIAIRL